LDAFSATDAVGLDDHRDLRRLVRASAAIERQCARAQRQRQCARAGISAGRASIGIRLAARHRFCIRAATRVTALSALGLRQQSIQTFDEIDGHRR
jgi:hypothetical protein